MMVVMAVVVMTDHTSNKLMHTLLVVAHKMASDYKIHRMDYLWMMMMMTLKEDEMVLLFRLAEIFDVFLVNALADRRLMKNKNFEEIHPKFKKIIF